MWATGPSIERVLLEAPADAELMRDIAPIRKQVVQPR